MAVQQFECGDFLLFQVSIYFDAERYRCRTSKHNPKLMQCYLSKTGTLINSATEIAEKLSLNLIAEI